MSLEEGSVVVINEMKRPGFGWAFNGKHQSVWLYDGGHCLNDLGEDFLTEFPLKFMLKYLKECDHYDPSLIDLFSLSFQENFKAAMENKLITFFNERMIEDQYRELETSRRSNGRSMKWDIMLIKPNVSFRLHAHPNMEIIYVIQGTMHEFRYTGHPPKVAYSESDVSPPDLRNLPLPKADHHNQSWFSHQCIQSPSSIVDFTEISKSFIINDKGSMHLTFTRDEGACLLVLWSGAHVTIPLEYQPSGWIPTLPDTVLPA